jgi:hypothetical protein
MFLVVIGILLGIMVLVIVAVWPLVDEEGEIKNKHLAPFVWSAMLLACVSASLVLIVLMAGPVFYFQSISDYGDLRGIQGSFISVEQTIEKTKSAFYVVDERVLFDAANLQQSTNVSEAISKARDVILEYNRKLQKYKAKREYALSRWLCARIPDDLKPLVWSEK